MAEVYDRLGMQRVYYGRGGYVIFRFAETSESGFALHEYLKADGTWTAFDSDALVYGGKERACRRMAGLLTACPRGGPRKVPSSQ